MLKDPERATRLVEDLPSLLAEHGVDPSRAVITHCQSHHRSGFSYMVGRLLGFRQHSRLSRLLGRVGQSGRPADRDLTRAH